MFDEYLQRELRNEGIKNGAAVLLATKLAELTDQVAQLQARVEELETR